jgi:hypothetical protein
MFVNINHLNEGGAIKSFGDDQKKLLNEGENPKEENKNEIFSAWQGTHLQTHVNRNWEKLRK